MAKVITKQEKMKIVSDWLKEEMKNRGWTQSALARVVETTPESISGYVRQRCLPNPYHLYVLCQALDRDYDELMNTIDYYDNNRWRRD